MFQNTHRSLVKYCIGFLAITMCLVAASAPAADLYWNAPAGGAGTWDTTTSTISTTTNWSTTSTGPNDSAWDNSLVNNAIMQGSAGGNITVDAGGVSVQNLTLENAAAPDYNFLAGGGTITFVGTTPTLMLPTTAMTTNIRVPLAGTSGLVINSPATSGASANLWLEAASTLSGVKDIQSTVQVTLGNDAAFGAYAGGAADRVIVREGAQVVAWVARTVNNNMELYGVGSGTGGVIRVGGNQTLTLNGAITLGTSTTSNITLKADGGSRLVINGNIDGSASNSNLTMQLDGSTASTIAGSINLGSGTLIKNGAPLILLGTANTWTGNTTVAGNLQIGDGTATGSLPDAGIISVSGTLNFNSTNNFTFSTATITGGGITLSGSGTVTLSNPSGNTYSGATNINNGALVITNLYSLGSTSALNIGGGASTGVLQIDGTGGSVTVIPTVTLLGRSAATAPHLQNLVGANSLYSSVSLIEGANDGSQYVIQSDAGSSLSIGGNIENNSAVTATTPRNMVLQGAGDGEVVGVIGGGTNSATINVTKSGTGTWTLKGYNTYTGSTTVNNGMLVVDPISTISSSSLIGVQGTGILDISGFGSGGFVLGSVTAQKLQGTGTVNGTVNNALGTIAPGGDNVAGTLNINDLNLGSTSGGLVNFDLSSSTSSGNDLLNVTGTLSALGSSGSTTFAINALSGSFALGTYKLVDYGTWNPSGSMGNISLQVASATRQIFALNRVGNEIDLNVTGSPAASLIWKGNVANSNWNRSTSPTKNWTNSSIDDYYYDLDSVTFDDSGSAYPNVNITGAWSPGTVIVNSSANYTISGVGGFSGAGTTLTKSGTGTLVIANTGANNIGGQVTINAGVLQVGNGVNTGGGIGTGNVVNNATLIVNRPDDSIISLISGSGALIKQSTGTLTLSATNNSYSGGNTIQGGLVSVSLLVNGGLPSGIGSSSSAASNLILNGGGLKYTGPSVTIDRMFTLGTGPSAGFLDSSGSGRLIFGGTGALTFTGTGSRTLNLTGSQATNATSPTNFNGVAALIGDGPGGVTSITKSGTGQWKLTNANTYTGGTTINGGMLVANNVNALGAATNTTTVNAGGTLSLYPSAAGSYLTISQANVVLNGGTLLSDDGHNILNSPVNFTTGSTLTTRWWDKDFTLLGPVTGTGDLYINGIPAPYLSTEQYTPGAVILAGTSNSWTGTTTIYGYTGTNQGRSSLQIGNAGVGSIPLGSANAITINVGGRLVFNTTNDIAITDAPISGGGMVSNWGSGTLTLSGTNPAFTGTLEVGGGVFYATGGATTRPALNRGTLRVTNPNAVTAVSYATFAGGNSAARLELLNNISFSSLMTLTYGGRQPIVNPVPHIVNISGNNTLGPLSTISFTTGGNQYYLQSDADTLTVNNITNNTASSAARYLYLQGAGNGQVGGAITNGTGTGAVYLTKNGTGTWTLSGVNTYTGPTTVLAGTLALGAAGSITNSSVVDVRSGATLDVSLAGAGSGMTLGATQTLGGAGTVSGNIISVAGATLAPGGLYNVGTLTVNSSVTLTGTGGDTINYNVGGSTGDLLSIGGTGTLTLPTSGVTTINVVPTSAITAGTYTVASAGSVVGSATNLAATTTSRYTLGAITVTGTGVTLGISGSNSSLTWAGTGSQAWDVKTTAAWNSGNQFWQSDDVTFDDTATLNTVAIGSGVTVLPMSVTVNNNTKAYVISGTGGAKISGSTGLTKTGTGQLTISNANDYSGTTSVTNGLLIVSGSIGPYSPLSITGGTYRISSNTSLGDNTQWITAPTTINGGTLDVNGYNNAGVSNEMISVQGTGAGGVGAIINLGASTLSALHYVTLTGDTTFGGTGASRWDLGRYTGPAGAAYLAGNGYTLTKTGTNQIILIDLGYTNLGSATVNGVVVNQGDLCLQGTTVVGTSTTLAPIVANTNGQLSLWGGSAGMTLNNNVTLNGGGIGSSLSDAGALTFTGSITLSGGGKLNVANTAGSTFTGAIGGTGDFTKTATVPIGTGTANNTGAATFSGSTSNTYNGATNMYAGTLNLQKSGGMIAIPGNLNIGDAGTTGWDVVNLAASQQIADTGVVALNGANNNFAYLNLMGFNETIGGLSDSSTFGIVQIQDTSTVNTNSTLTVNTALSTSYSFNGRLRDKFAGAGTGKLNFVKDGSGTQILTGSNITYTGNTTVNGGLLDVPNLNTPNSTVTATTGGNLIATSITANTLTIGAGSTVTIRAIPGGPLSGFGSLSAVPEPSTWAMLMLAAMGLGIYWRRGR